MRHLLRARLKSRSRFGCNKVATDRNDYTAHCSTGTPEQSSQLRGALRAANYQCSVKRSGLPVDVMHTCLLVLHVCVTLSLPPHPGQCVLDFYHQLGTVRVINFALTVIADGRGRVFSPSSVPANALCSDKLHIDGGGLGV